MKKETAQRLLEKTKRDYEQIAQEFSDTRVYPWKELQNLVEEYVKDGNKILDVGCGNGRLCQLFENHKVEYVGIDSSPTLIQKAREKYSYEFKVADALDLPLEDNVFDFIFCIALLHHIPSKEFRQQALDNIHRVLKPGGFLIMTNWNLWQPKFWKYFLTNYALRVTRYGLRDLFVPWKLRSGRKIQRYYYAFTLRVLKKILKTNNFEILKNYYVRKGKKVHWWNGYNIVIVGRSQK